MKFGKVALDDADGHILAHSLPLPSGRLAKGQKLDAAALSLIRAAGIAAIVVARLEAGDIEEDRVAAAVGARLCGKLVAVERPLHGRVDLVARADGLVDFAPRAITRLNEKQAEIAVALRWPNAPVRCGDVIGTIKIIPYGLGHAMLQDALRTLRGARVNVAAYRPFRALLIQTVVANDASAKLIRKTQTVIEQRLAAVGGSVSSCITCHHAEEALARALTAQTGNIDVILVVAASATADENDVVPAAIRRAGGVVVRVGMPTDPGNLFCLAQFAEIPILGLPGCARSPVRNGIDLIIERFSARLPIDSRSIAAMGVGGFLR